MSSVDSPQTVPFVAHSNGATDTLPHVGCLLIYSTQLVWSGHVAVVVDVDTAGRVQVAEQNWSNDIWLGKNFAREIAFSRGSGGVTLHDEHLIGWKCVQP